MSMNKKDRKVGFSVNPDGRVYPMIMVPGNVQESIPTNIYRVRFDSEDNKVYLEASEFPEPPAKIYGENHKECSRYFRTFEMMDSNLGIGLYGLKGTGKTTTLQIIAKTALGMDYPVLIIDSALPLSMIGQMLSLIKQTIIVMFDEFDKNYYDAERSDSKSDQNGILTILDGSSGGGKRMTIICANEYGKINEYLKDRPGRIRYNKFFAALSPAEVITYLKDNVSKEISPVDVIRISEIAACGAMTYDMLKSYVTESNIHKENVIDSIILITPNVTRSYGYGTSKFLYHDLHGMYGDNFQPCLLKFSPGYEKFYLFSVNELKNKHGYSYMLYEKIHEGHCSEIKAEFNEKQKLNINLGEIDFIVDRLALMSTSICEKRQLFIEEGIDDFDPENPDASENENLKTQAKIMKFSNSRQQVDTVQRAFGQQIDNTVTGAFLNSPPQVSEQPTFSLQVTRGPRNTNTPPI